MEVNLKNLKGFLHILLTIASVIGFLGGWATLAHSRKPGQVVVTPQAQVTDPLPPLDPLPDLGVASNSSNNSNLNFVMPSTDPNSSDPGSSSPSTTLNPVSPNTSNNAPTTNRTRRANRVNNNQVQSNPVIVTSGS
jgi:hypothetical protein